jgi:hypothetical protein
MEAEHLETIVDLFRTVEHNRQRLNKASDPLDIPMANSVTKDKIDLSSICLTISKVHFGSKIYAVVEADVKFAAKPLISVTAVFLVLRKQGSRPTRARLGHSSSAVSFRYTLCPTIDVRRKNINPKPSNICLVTARTNVKLCSVSFATIHLSEEGIS